MRLSDAGPVNAVPEASQHGTAASLVTGPTPTELVARPRVSPKRQMPTTEPDESGSNVSRPILVHSPDPERVNVFPVAPKPGHVCDGSLARTQPITMFPSRIGWVPPLT